MKRTKALSLISEFSIAEFIEKIARPDISEKRKKQFYEVVIGTIHIDDYCKFDIK